MSSQHPFSQEDQEGDSYESLLRTSSSGNGTTSRRRNITQTTSTKETANTTSSHNFPENYTYVSATPFTPPDAEPTSYHQPLQSQTYGGFGPVHPNVCLPADDDSKKAISLPFRMMRRCTNGLRYCGCTNHAMIASEGPDREYYRDDFNDQPSSWTIGTSEEDGIWMNRKDSAGSVMAFMVWFLLGYSAFTITFLAETGGIDPMFSMIYVILCAMALACHVKVTFSDPGTVPASAQPVPSLQKHRDPKQPHALCSQCNTFKPPFSHHCRICKRCISRMDHHCPWMNNCIGAGNMKHFILFLGYTWSCSVMALSLLGWNYFFCVSDTCMFGVLLIQLSRITLFLSTGALLFTSSMLMNVTYGECLLFGPILRMSSLGVPNLNFVVLGSV